jgi:hypothetical protein
MTELVTNAAAFQQARSSFEARLTIEEKERFRFSTREDVQATILKIQDGHTMRKQLRNIGRLEVFFTRMESYASILEVFLNTSEIMAFIWGPMKYLLQASKTNPPCSNSH